MATSGIYDHKKPIPLRAFPNINEAETWQARLIEYHLCQPEHPLEDDQALWEKYSARMKEWRNAHPAGVEASHYKTFGVYPVPFGLEVDAG